MSPELCFNYFQRISAIIQKFSVSLIIPFNCFLKILLQNIYDILPHSYKANIFKDNVLTKNLKIWNSLGFDRIVNDVTKECLLTKKLHRLMDDFLQGNINVETYYEMVSSQLFSI